jgi:hypothetical protein
VSVPANRNESGFIVIVVPLIIIIIICIVVFSHHSPKATYEAKVQDYSVVDPATLRVDVKVHNTGKGAGKPSCHIEADNGTRAYHGFDRVERDKDLGAGEWWGFAQNM